MRRKYVNAPDAVAITASTGTFASLISFDALNIIYA